jgi:hypothetical protein
MWKRALSFFYFISFQHYTKCGDSTKDFLVCVQLTILVWEEPKIKRPGASRSPIVHLRTSRSTQVTAGETTP